MQKRLAYLDLLLIAVFPRFSRIWADHEDITAGVHAGAKVRNGLMSNESGESRINMWALSGVYMRISQSSERNQGCVCKDH